MVGVVVYKINARKKVERRGTRRGTRMGFMMRGVKEVIGGYGV
jgi:hypothetical protein